MLETRKLTFGAAALVIVQLIHGAIPGPAEGGSLLGPIVGAALIIGAVVAFFGARRAKPWASDVLRYTGLGVAVGFLTYHAIPLKTPLNYPYWGTVNANAGQWAPVIAAIAVGGWCAWISRPSADAHTRITERSATSS
ncbi:MAG: hypothetical protein ACYDH6_13025 [Acidimicrobiales bacterium]